MRITHWINITRRKRGLGHDDAPKLIKAAIRAALDAEKVDVPCELNVFLTDNEDIREVNREFRKIDKATDVLSFPMNEFVPGKFDPEGAVYDFDEEKTLLGDILISLERVQEQGEEYGHGFEHELSYITVHSVLHLLGYDHVDEGEMKAQMRKREKEIMLILGI